MKILSLANEIKSDIASSGIRLKKATSEGYSIALRTAKIYNQGSLYKYYNTTRSIGDKIIKSTSKKDIPYVAGAIGLLIPFPFMSPLLMGLGFLFSMNTSKNKQVLK